MIGCARKAAPLLPETTYSTTTRLTPEDLWAFVEDMDNWAPFMVGYQSHEKISHELSEWTLKGDAGPLARIVTFRVHITEWNGPERVSFRLEGVNEDMGGGGSFEISAGDSQEPPPPRPGAFARAWAAILRVFGIGSSREASEGGTRMTFHLELEPRGPMAPMISAMIQPALLPAAQNLVHQVLDRLEGGARV
jgi:carbon monoxide dehydrogenase subunit G